MGEKTRWLDKPIVVADVEPLPAVEPIRRKLPGKPMRVKELLREFNESTEDLRKRLDPAFWVIFAPGKPEEVFAWRVQLDCGCIHDTLVQYDKRGPHEVQRQSASYPESKLAPGYMTCRHDDDLSHLYRRIASWDAREERTFDADPVEPPDCWGTDPELWEKTRRRRKHTSAIWTVTLTCGHRQHVHTSLTYDPATSKPQLVTLKRQREMQAEWDAYEPPNDRQEQLNYQHHLRMVAERWPRPMPEHECYLCPHVRRMVAIEPRGPLITPEPQPTREERDAKRRASIGRRLAQAQREVERLHTELKELSE